MNRQLSGLRAWVIQRLSAVYMALFLLVALSYVGTATPDSHPAWTALVARPGVSIALALFFAALLYHVWVGVRNVILDYVRPAALRLTVLALLWGWLLFLAVWLLRILLRVMDATGTA